MFVFFELLLSIIFLVLLINLVRYFFFRELHGGGLFGLSDQWIKNETKKEEK